MKYDGPTLPFHTQIHKIWKNHFSIYHVSFGISKSYFSPFNWPTPCLDLGGTGGGVEGWDGGREGLPSKAKVPWDKHLLSQVLRAPASFWAQVVQPLPTLPCNHDASQTQNVSSQRGRTDSKSRGSWKGTQKLPVTEIYVTRSCLLQSVSHCITTSCLIHFYLVY